MIFISWRNKRHQRILLAKPKRTLIEILTLPNQKKAGGLPIFLKVVWKLIIISNRNCLWFWLLVIMDKARTDNISSSCRNCADNCYLFYQTRNTCYLIAKILFYLSSQFEFILNFYHFRFLNIRFIIHIL